MNSRITLIFVGDLKLLSIKGAKYSMDYLAIFWLHDYPSLHPSYPLPVAEGHRNTAPPQGPLLFSNFGDQEVIMIIRNTPATSVSFVFKKIYSSQIRHIGAYLV